MLFQAIRLVHIISGFTAVLLGIASMLAPKKRGLHTTLGSAYHAFMIVICASAAALAVLNWRQSWYFLLISIFSYWYALMGIRAVRKRGPGWLKIHIKGAGFIHCHHDCGHGDERRETARARGPATLDGLASTNADRHSRDSMGAEAKWRRKITRRKNRS